EEDRLLKARFVIEGRHHPVVRFEHFAGRFGILAFVDVPQAGSSQVGEVQTSAHQEQKEIMAHAMMKESEHSLFLDSTLHGSPIIKMPGVYASPVTRVARNAESRFPKKTAFRGVPFPLATGDKEMRYRATGRLLGDSWATGRRRWANLRSFAPLGQRYSLGDGNVPLKSRTAQPRPFLGG